MLAALLASILTAGPLDEARVNLAAGKLDEVLFALQGKVFHGDEGRLAAEILARAGSRALGRSDFVLSLQFAQMALRQEKAQALALEVAARSCLVQKQFGPAEEYADRWLDLGEPPSARVLRAEIALEQGEWDRALSLVDGLPMAALKAEERGRTRLIRRTARREIGDRNARLSAVKALEAKAEAAAERAARLRAAGGEAARPANVQVDGPRVIVYGTTWCGYCKKAKRWLKSRGIEFLSKDVEKDPGAAEELAEKAARARLGTGGVPVIDVGGKLVVGFDEAALARLLKL